MPVPYVNDADGVVRCVADACTIRKVTASGTVTTVLGKAGECGIRLGKEPRTYASFGIVVLGPKRLALASHDAVLVADLP